MSEFTEQRYDYSKGRQDAPELTIMVGISGSGKSTVVKGWINWSQGKIVRLNRDEIRKSMYVDVPWDAHHDDFLRVAEREMARLALSKSKDVIVDDTNCIRKTRYAWEALAKDMRVRFRVVTMTTSIEVCIERDKLRADSVGEAVIRKQYKDLMETIKLGPKEDKPVLTRPVFEREQLLNGGFTLRLPDAKIVIFDVDGTLANHEGVRNEYDNTRIMYDNPYPIVVEWAKAVYPYFNLFILSGRKDFCGDDTCDWMEMQGVPFDHILMRRTKDNRPDTVIKEEILDELLTVFSLDQFAFVVDDRPKVVRMWKRRGLKVYPVRGTELHKTGCPYETQQGYTICPECGALEDF